MARNMFWARGISKEKAKGEETPPPVFHVLVSEVCVTNYHKLGGSKQQKFILSQSCRPEVQNQGVGRAIFPLKSLEENPSLPLPGFWELWATLDVLGLWLHYSNSFFFK